MIIDSNEIFTKTSEYITNLKHKMYSNYNEGAKEIYFLLSDTEKLLKHFNNHSEYNNCVDESNQQQQLKVQILNNLHILDEVYKDRELVKKLNKPKTEF